MARLLRGRDSSWYTRSAVGSIQGIAARTPNAVFGSGLWQQRPAKPQHRSGKAKSTDSPVAAVKQITGRVRARSTLAAAGLGGAPQRARLTGRQNERVSRGGF